MTSRRDLSQQSWCRGPCPFSVGQFLEELRHGGRRRRFSFLPGPGEITFSKCAVWLAEHRRTFRVGSVSGSSLMNIRYSPSSTKNALAASRISAFEED